MEINVSITQFLDTNIFAFFLALTVIGASKNQSKKRHCQRKLSNLDFYKIFTKKLKLKNLMEQMFKIGHTEMGVNSIYPFTLFGSEYITSSMYGISNIDGGIWIYQKGRIDVYSTLGRAKLQDKFVRFNGKKVYIEDIKMSHNGHIIAVDKKHIFRIDKTARVLKLIKSFRNYDILDLCIVE